MEQPPIVQSVERTFAILELLAQQPRGLTLSELSMRTELHKSTAHRLLSCLGRLGYVTQAEQNGCYRLTFKLFETASRFVEGVDVLAVARPHLDFLSAAAKEAVHLVVPNGINITYVYKVDSAAGSSVRMSSRVGLSIPMYCTGVGKAILAQLPPEQAAAIWDASPIRALTPNTLVSWSDFSGQLGEIRAQGYALDNEENELGVRCMAMPILDYKKSPVAAFSVSAPLSRMSNERLEALLPLMTQALQGIKTEFWGIAT